MLEVGGFIIIYRYLINRSLLIMICSRSWGHGMKSFRYRILFFKISDCNEIQATHNCTLLDKLEIEKRIRRHFQDGHRQRACPYLAQLAIVKIFFLIICGISSWMCGVSSWGFFFHASVSSVSSESLACLKPIPLNH